jgi:hypothetical protein
VRDLRSSAAAGAAGIGGCVLVLKSPPFVGRMDGSMRLQVTMIGVLIGYLGNYSG